MVGDFSQSETIALHRVMMGQPNMLILDEATPSIDHELEDSKALSTSDGRAFWVLSRGAPFVDDSYRGCDSCLKDGHVDEKEIMPTMEQRGLLQSLSKSVATINDKRSVSSASLRFFELQSAKVSYMMMIMDWILLM